MIEKEIINNNSTLTDESVTTAELDNTIQTVSHSIEDAITKEIGVTETEDVENTEVLESELGENQTLEETDVTEASEDEGNSNEVLENSEEIKSDEFLKDLSETNEQDEPEEELTEQERRILKAKETAKWYVLHTFSSYENVAKENLEIVVDKFNLHERIFDIIIPMEDVVEEKNGKKQLVQRKVMPGYILVKMNYGDDIWHAVTRTRGITGFVGPKGRPLHLTEEEIRKMQLEKSTVVDITIAVNDKVEVLEGPLNGFTGIVVSVDAVSHKCRVVVEMFGRETPVDLMLNQIRKVS